jgi:SAM-dependent methyltransferase
MNDYVSFYEKADRDNVYSSGHIGDNDKFYPKLIKIKQVYFQNKLPKVLEIGAGNGRYQDIFNDYTAIDITESSRKYFHKPYIVIEDNKPYPFTDDTFDLIFTNAVFEHIPNINLALKEVTRVVKMGGYVVFNPAWQCRPWAKDGYPVRPYSDFNIFGKIYKASILLRENLLFRLSYTMPKRLYYLLKYLLNKDSFKNELVYTKIDANYEQFWMSDSDACNSIDPFMAILYFKVNDFEISNYPTLIKQFLIRTNEIIIKKNK